MTDMELLHAIYTDIQGISERFQTMDQNLKNAVHKLSAVETLLDNLQGKVEGLELTMENVINKNIELIAEGHLDISRKLDSALMVESEKEMLLIRVNALEDEVRRIKETIEQIA